jgi:hypothetical protein
MGLVARGLQGSAVAQCMRSAAKVLPLRCLTGGKRLMSVPTADRMNMVTHASKEVGPFEL